MTSTNTKAPKRVRILKRDPRRGLITPQANKVLQHLSDTGTITQREALLDYSVQSLTRRITELRDAGFNVAGSWKNHPTTGQRYMRYALVG